jgi:hypothetical protein
LRIKARDLKLHLLQRHPKAGSGFHIRFRGNQAGCSNGGLAVLFGHLLADGGDLGVDTTHSMLRLIARSPRSAHRAGMLDKAVSVTPAVSAVVSVLLRRRNGAKRK